MIDINIVFQSSQSLVTFLLGRSRGADGGSCEDNLRGLRHHHALPVLRVRLVQVSHPGGQRDLGGPAGGRDGDRGRHCLDTRPLLSPLLRASDTASVLPGTQSE